MNEFTRRGLIFGMATAAAYGLLVGVERVCLSAFADSADRASLLPELCGAAIHPQANQRIRKTLTNPS